MDQNQDFHDWVREIQRSDRSEVDKMREYFERVTAQIIDFTGKEIELAKAMQDREALVKVQIKLETMKTARSIFAQGYQIATGRKISDEQNDR